jgi:hypothetical protein
MLYLLPDELLIAIVECCDQTTRKGLSLVSRRLRNPCQMIIFKVVSINFAPRRLANLGKHITPDDRLLSYIMSLFVSSNIAGHIPELLTALHRMQALRKITVWGVSLTTPMLDQLCEILSTQFLTVKLWSCAYPTPYMIQQSALKVRKPTPATTRLLTAFIEKSLSTITNLL